MKLVQRAKLFFGFIILAFVALWDPRGTQKLVDDVCQYSKDKRIHKDL